MGDVPVGDTALSCLVTTPDESGALANGKAYDCVGLEESRFAGASGGMGAPAVVMEPTKTRKSDETRARILEAALVLFLERGYQETTMRAIADRAGVAVGNAYYYFESKEHLIQAFYARTHAEHVAASREVLANATTFRDRLRGLMHTKIDTIEPYHQFAGILFRTAADPQSPLHPLSEQSAPVRDEATAIFAEALDGSTSRVPSDLRAELPRLLWLYHMGIVLFWIHDSSPGRRRTRHLVDGTVSIIASLVALSGNPLLRPVRKRALRLLRETMTGVEETPNPST
jgi:AcrR family transcriptional regulator